MFYFWVRADVLYDVPVQITVLLSIFYGSISLLAVIGNSLVIWIVATTRQMQTVTNLFIANLALADVVIGMFVIPFQVIRCLFFKKEMEEQIILSSAELRLGSMYSTLMRIILAP